VEQGWKIESRGGNNTFLKAMNSYLLITYLDELLSDSIGNYIGKNKKLT